MEVQLTPDLQAKLNRLATESGRDTQALVQEALERFVDYDEWFLREVDGVRTVGHAGSANGQFAELLIVPERNFAVMSLSNAGPDGILFNQAAVRMQRAKFRRF